MPLYEYRCTTCGRRFEVLRRVGQGPEGLACPAVRARRGREGVLDLRGVGRGRRRWRRLLLALQPLHLRLRTPVGPPGRAAPREDHLGRGEAQRGTCVPSPRVRRSPRPRGAEARREDTVDVLPGLRVVRRARAAPRRRAPCGRARPRGCRGRLGRRQERLVEGGGSGPRARVVAREEPRLEVGAQVEEAPLADSRPREERLAEAPRAGLAGRPSQKARARRRRRRRAHVRTRRDGQR